MPPNEGQIKRRSGKSENNIKRENRGVESNPTRPRMELAGKSYYDITGGVFNFKKYVEYTGGQILKGFQLRYIYFIDKRCREHLTVPEIPFSEIDRLGAGMYKGEKTEKTAQSERHAKKTIKNEDINTKARTIL